jgi:hypothetical protein
MTRNTGSDLRRSQLITPFGVGALNVREDGSSVITCGLDYWMHGINEVDRAELEIEDSRLKERLRVGKLFKPPAVSDSFDQDRGNRSSSQLHPIPVLRFPTWFSCKVCGRLDNKQPHFRGIVYCPTAHGKEGAKTYQVQMFQVPYVALCAKGHLDDFPWSEWVHKSVSPTCAGPIFLREAKSGNLQNSTVSCPTCGMHRSMDMAMSSSSQRGRSNLSLMLDSTSGIEFTCTGLKPWLGSIPGENDNCGEDVFGSFRGAGNVYFPFIESSILIPEGTRQLDYLVERLRGSDFVYPRQLARNDIAEAVKQINKIVEILCQEMGTINWIKDYSDEDIVQALSLISNAQGIVQKAISSQNGQQPPTPRNDFLRAEYLRLQQSSDDPRLNVINPSGTYGDEVSKIFSDIRLIASLTETRAFWGFSRLETGNKKGFIDSRNMLRRYRTTPSSTHDWLPAIQIKGEGIFFNISSEVLSLWEQKAEVSNRMAKIGTETAMVDSANTDISPRFVLLHTLSHLIMKELTYFCGYSQASLRERLYVSSQETNKMSGFLIYTASGDSEGTLGGLVRMGKPGYLEEVVQKVIEKAKWCSNDPVCMETGNNQKIGGDASTLASCYACTLMPETSCEHFNKFLDRGFLIGTPEQSQLAFYSSN